MSSFYLILSICFFSIWPLKPEPQRIFDVHIHGSERPDTQLSSLAKAGVYQAALSSSWDLQESYRDRKEVNLLFGLMFPCPNGKVPYSLQGCYADGAELPSLVWVEEQIKAGRIDFLGEVLSQYYGISASDSLLLPYYTLAQKYRLPVGIHLDGAGPDHGSPNFKMELGNPLLLNGLLDRFPDLRVWIMHSGDQFYREAISLMKQRRNVYADLSVISNPDILPPAQFTIMLKAFLDAGLEDRLMFGSDNGDISKVRAAIESSTLLSQKQKNKISYVNAERFFRR